jgi:hypothetical protein
MVFDSMRGFYTENGLENQRKSSPFVSRCVAASLRNVATQGGPEATVSVTPAIGSPIDGVMTSQIKGLGVETIGPITTQYKGRDFSTSSSCQSQGHILVVVFLAYLRLFRFYVEQSVGGRKMVPRDRIELSTPAFSGLCSTN